MYDELSDQLAILGTKMVCMFCKIIWGCSMNTCRQLSNSENWIFYCRVWPHMMVLRKRITTCWMFQINIAKNYSYLLSRQKFTWNVCVPHFNVLVRDTVFANNFSEPTATLQAGCFGRRPQVTSGEAARKITLVTIQTWTGNRSWKVSGTKGNWLTEDNLTYIKKFL